MTYQQEILARAMNHIDDDLIRTAHGPRKKLRRAIPVIIILCLAVVLAIAFPYLREIINTDSDVLNPEDESIREEHPGLKPESDSHVELNRPATLGGTTMTLVEVTDATATFEITKTDNTAVYAMLYGLRSDVLATTEPNFKDNGVVIRSNILRVYVNDSETYGFELPTAEGTYRITIDFTSIRNGTYPMQECIGLYAYMGEENAAAMVSFSLKVPEESETTVETDAETDVDTSVESSPETSAETSAP